MEQLNRTHLGLPGHNAFQQIHFIGIGGVGMSGIAEILLNEGFAVSGSDLSTSATVERLRQHGGTIYTSHKASNVHHADLVVISTAIQADNAELKEARRLRLPVIRRATMLAELMRFRYGIAVSGTHGKTTTTCLVANVLAGGDLDPTYVIGGQVSTLKSSNARLGSSPYLVAEADESDGSFLDLLPAVAVVTNIDQDHLQAYDGDMHHLQHAFVQFLHKLPFYGHAFMCIDDPGVRAILPKVERPCVTYGFSEQADLQAVDFKQKGLLSCYTLKDHIRQQTTTVELSLPGKHNVLNSLAAIGIGLELGVDRANLLKTFANFPGVKKRFQFLGHIAIQAKGYADVILDYAHHPSELSAVIETARACWEQHRLVFVFQPHRYSRTRDLLDNFALVLEQVDLLLVLDVYAAGEPSLPDADAQALCRSIRTRKQLEPIYVGDNANLAPTLMRLVQDGDKIILSGAGDISDVAHQLVAEYET